VAAAARAEWEALAGSSDRARVAEFLAAYPDGELAEAARLKIAELDRVEEERAAEAARLAATRARAAELQSSAEAAERTLWDQVARSDDRAELLRYVAAYPAGRYIEQANARLLEIDGTEAARVAAAAAKAQEARRAREQAEETARWESARADGSRASVLGYLKEYPEGRFAKDARVKLDEIARIEDAAAAEAAKRADAERRTRVAALEDAAWKKVAGTDDVAKLKAFLSSYPDGTKAADAKREIARLESAERDKLVAAGRKAEEQRLARTRAEEDAAWRRADDAGTTAGLKEYLATWADGQYAEQARERLDQLARAEAERAAEIARQEEERQQAEAERLAAAQSKAEQQAAELAAWDAVKDGDDVAALDSFLAKYPDGRFASIARQTVESLRKIEESKEDAARMLTQNQRHRRR
jgi:hypothetical protein